MKSIAFQNFKQEAKLRGKEYIEAITRVIDSGWYILGPEVEAFEEEFAQYTQSKFAIGVSNGLEAIQIALMALGVGPGDEVITTPLSAIATTLAIEAVGATPIFVDIDEQGLIDIDKIKQKLSGNTRAIVPVHLYGNVVNVLALKDFCVHNNLYLIEDSAQAHGATLHNRMVGSFGDFGCWSFYPTKNLGAIGDAGALTTNNHDLAQKAKKIRDYGQSSKYEHEVYGLNSRLDELQAALLRTKLKHLPDDIIQRRKIASIYEELDMLDGLKTLKLENNSESARHLFVIRTERRDALMDYLNKSGITALVHYPKLIPDQKLYSQKYKDLSIPTARRFVNEIISLPIHPFMTMDDAMYVRDVVAAFNRV